MMQEKPEAIMINVPDAFFRDKGKHHKLPLFNIQESGLIWFKTYYEYMGLPNNEENSFYHFISNIPIHAKDLLAIYICFSGKVQYKAIIVEFIKKSNCADRGFRNYPIRNWVVTTGPVIKPPFEIPQKGFRGFRYCKMLF